MTALDRLRLDALRFLQILTGYEGNDRFAFGGRLGAPCEFTREYYEGAPREASGSSPERFELTLVTHSIISLNSTGET